jgi:hypothetical protein
MEELKAEEIKMVWERTIFKPVCPTSVAEEVEEKEKEWRRRYEPGYWAREQQAESVVDKEIMDLSAQLEKCGIASEEVEAWLSIDEALSRTDLEGINLDDALDDAITAVIAGVTDLDLRSAMQGGVEESDGEEEEGEELSEEQVSLQDVKKMLVQCAETLDARSGDPSLGQRCRQLAYEAHQPMMASLRQASIEDYYG